MISRADVRAARDDLSAFCVLVGHPLTSWQAEALTLRTRTTAILSPRQCGKSYALAALAAWWAYRTPRQVVLVVSAGEEASKRLLATVRQITAHELLRGSVVDEGLGLVRLSNGSEIRSVPSSERQIRGWSVDLLIVDEAASVSDDVLLSAAIPTTAARPDARIVLGSSPWADAGAFYRFCQAGLQPDNADARTFRWLVGQAPWISQAVIDSARVTLPPARFAAEYLGEWVGAADAFLDPADVLACIAPYEFLLPHERCGTVVAGTDWGRRFDAHAVAVVGIADDHGVNPAPVAFLPWLEVSRRPYAEQVTAVAGLFRARRRGAWSLDDGPGLRGRTQVIGGGLTLHDNAVSLTSPRQRTGRFEVRAIFSESNGVGAAPSEMLQTALPGVDVQAIHTSNRSKEAAFGRLRLMLSRRQIVLPDNSDLLAQLRGLSCSVLPGGGLSIEASDPAVHDDAADALSQALAALPSEPRPGQPTPEPPGTTWVETPDGILLPRRPRPRTAALGARRGGFYSF